MCNMRRLSPDVIQMFPCLLGLTDMMQCIWLNELHTARKHQSFRLLRRFSFATTEAGPVADVRWVTAAIFSHVTYCTAFQWRQKSQHMRAALGWLLWSGATLCLFSCM